MHLREFVAFTLFLHFAASPASAGYTVETAFAGLSFQEPTQLVFAPGDVERAFVTERAGRVIVIRDLNTAAPTRETFLDLTSVVGDSGSDRGLLSIAFHPRFSTNGFFYLWYSTSQNGTRSQRLARFKVSSANPQRADLNSEFPLITQRSGPGGHDGGTILFGSDGYLYLSLGDGDSDFPEATESKQRIDRGFFGGVIRIDVDAGAGSLLPNPHPSVHPGAYRVPADNPFVGATSFNNRPVSGSDLRTEFWAVGLRNPFRLSFDARTGRLWCADVGLDLLEEINLILPGKNYGWNFREGSAAGPNAQQTPANVLFENPIWEYDHSHGLSITGGIVYRGLKFPELSGRYLFSDFVSGKIWALHDDGGRPLSGASVLEFAREGGVVSFTEDPRNGDVLMADLDDNVIRKLARTNDPLMASRLANLSTRGVVRDGAQSMIAGFVVRGGPKKLLLRAVGPGLAQFSVSNFLTRPQLALYRDQVFLARNVGWQTFAPQDQLQEATAAAGAFALPVGSDDAAMVVTLQPGSYTAMVDKFSGADGIGLVEVYDLDDPAESTSRLVNISTRAFVSEGEAILIPGIVVSGNAPRTVLLRAVGPGLEQFGVSSVLQRPVLKLFAGSAQIAENTGWTTTGNSTELAAAMSRVGAFALSPASADSALIATLAPGSYTLHLSGVANTSGVALVEVYEVE